MNGKFARKVFQKIVAVGTGVGMVGATLMGASAYTLADYPSPFIQDGIFSGQIVIGAAAKTSDVIGATDIATSLQFATAATGSAMGAKVSGAGDSTLIAEGGDFLNLDEFFSDVVDAGLDDSDLPNALRDGEFDENEGLIDNDETYTQELNWPKAGGPKLVFEDDDDSNEEVGDYVKFDNSDIIFSYELEFDTPIEYTVGAAAADLEDSVFEMQGKVYTITDIKETAGALKAVEVIGGETLTVLQRGEVRNYVLSGNEYEVEVLDVTDPDAEEEECLVSVNGEVRAIEEDDTEDFFKNTDQEVVVGVTDIFQLYAERGNSACEMIFGTEDIEFEDSSEVEVGGIDIGDRDDDPDVDTDVTITTTNTSTLGKWERMIYNVTSRDDVYLGSSSDGNEWVDPVLKSLKISYHGLHGETEMASLDASTDDMTFTLTNNEKRDVRIEGFTDDDESVYWGDDDDEVLLMEAAQTQNVTHMNVSTLGEFFDVRGDGSLYKSMNTIIINKTGASIVDLEETKLFIVTKGQSIHIVSVQDIDTSDSELDFDDETYGRDYDDEDPVGAATLSLAGAVMSFDLGSIGTIKLQLWDAGNMSLGTWPAGSAVALRATDIRLSDGVNTGLTNGTARGTLFETGAETWGESIVVLREINESAAGDDRAVQVNILETDDITDIAAGNRSIIGMIAEVDEADDEIKFVKPTALDILNVTSFAGTGKFQDESDSNDNDQYAMTRAGSLVHIEENADDSGDIDNIDLELVVGEARYGLAYVSEIPVTILAGGAGGTTATRIEVGATVLDRNAAQIGADNMIVVGGPCVNTVAAELMGNPADCTEGFEAGKAMIKLYERTGKVALLVAGYSAEDTTRAARFLAQYEANKDKLEGMELEIGLTTVTKVA